MSKVRTLGVAVGATTALVAATVAGAAPSGAATAARSTTVVAESAAPFTGSAQPTGALRGSDPLTIQLWLAPDAAAAERFATAVSTPGDRLFRRYLSPAAFTARFGASDAVAQRAESWLRAEGFTAVHADAQRDYIRATAPVSTVDAALDTTIETYRSTESVNAGPNTLWANDGPVSLPSSLAADVLGVTGLDDAAPTTTMVSAPTAPATGRHGATPCSDYYGEEMVGGLPEAYGTTSFPTVVCGYSAVQMRAAYGATWTDTGKGQTIALVELGLTKDMFLTLEDYDHANGLPAPAATRYEELSLGKDTCGDPFDGEEQLDVEISHDMAPDATQLVVGGDSCARGDYGLQGLFDADTAVIDGAGGHPLASVASNSWESGTESQPASVTDIEHAYLVRAASEGVGMYFSSGDGSGVLEPSVDPFAVAVGGTTLGIGAKDNRLFETGWSTGASVIRDGAWKLKGEDGAGGGGPSVRWPQPSYQIGVVPHRLGTTRTAPDISASADPFTGMALGQLSFPGGGKSPVYSQIPIGGTSESSPLVAGIVVAAQQGQPGPFGFIDPAIYDLAGTDAFFPARPLTAKSSALDRGLVCDVALYAHICGKPTQMTLTTFDDQDPAMGGYTGQVDLPGYDTMTGLGTPDGPDFVAALRKLER